MSNPQRITGAVRLCPHICSNFQDAVPSGYVMELTAIPPGRDQPFGELAAGLMKAGQGRVVSAGKARLRKSGRLSCDDTLLWKRTGCSEVTITYRVPDDCTWYRTVVHPARPPFWTAYGVPQWEWLIEPKYPTGKVIHPEQPNDSKWPRGEKLEFHLTTLKMVPGCWIMAEEYFEDGSKYTQVATRIVHFGTPTLTGGYITDVVDENKRLYKVAIFGEEYIVSAGDWREWERGIPLDAFVVLGPNCFSEEDGTPRPCPGTTDICTEGGDFKKFGPDDILTVEDYIIVPLSIEGVDPIGPAIAEYGPHDWTALLDAQVIPAIVEDRDLENDTADIDF